MLTDQKKLYYINYLMRLRVSPSSRQSIALLVLNDNGDGLTVKELNRLSDYCKTYEDYCKLFKPAIDMGIIVITTKRVNNILRKAFNIDFNKADEFLENRFDD